MRAVAVALVLVGCGPDNGLSGSLSSEIPLDVSRTEVYRNEEALQVTYFRNRGVFLDVVARVTVVIKDTGLPRNKKLELGGEYQPGNPRTTVAHAPGGEPVRVLPRVKRGDMVILEGGEAGGVTKGNFSVLFETEGGDLGFGKTLTGTFLAKTTVDAGF